MSVKLYTAPDSAITGVDVLEYVTAKALATSADAVATAADAIATEADRVATAADRVQTGLDRVQTGADRTQTGLDAAATAADRVAVAADKVSADADAVATAADRVAVAADRVLAETARDASFINSGTYASTTAGLAATTNGQQFIVIEGDEAQAYLNNAGVAEQIQDARYPNVKWSHGVRMSVGLAGESADNFISNIYGITTPSGLVHNSGALVRGSEDLILADCILQEAYISVSASGTARVLVIDAANKVIYDIAVTLASSGVNTVSLGNRFAPKGSRVCYLWVSGGGLNYGTAGASIQFSTPSPALGATVTPANSAANLALAFKVGFVKKALGIRATDTESSLRAAASLLPDTFRSGLIPTAYWAVGAVQIAAFTIGHDVGKDIPEGAIISGLKANMAVPAGADHVRTFMFVRDTSDGSIDTKPVLGVDTLVSSNVASIASLGLTAAAGVAIEVTIPVAPFAAEAGKTYFTTMILEDSANARVNFDLLGNATTLITSTQRRKGWYASATEFLNTHLLGAGSESSIGFSGGFKYDADRSTMDALGGFKFTVSGLTITTDGTYLRNGLTQRFSDTRTLTGATAGNVRYDLLYCDNILVFAVGVVAGTERTTDAAEFLPAIGSGSRKKIAVLRVTETGVTVIETWKLDAVGDITTISDSLNKTRSVGRRFIPKTLAKIRRGAAIKIAALGDSIMAQNGGGTYGGTTTPNGVARDKAAAPLTDSLHYFRDNIGADVVDAITLYTSVGLGVGRSDDGGGTIHTKTSYMWELVEYIKALGNSVTYDNWAVPGTASSSAVSGGSPAAWVTNIIATAPDIVFIGFGMNEQGSTTTLPNLGDIIIPTFQAAGIEVVVMGCPRKHPSTLNLLNWLYTERALDNAAKYTDSAFVPLAPLYDDKYYAAMGVSTLDTCNANANNHPGILEHVMIGKELIKLFFG
jgi:hypothetical protein